MTQVHSPLSVIAHSLIVSEPILWFERSTKRMKYSNLATVMGALVVLALVLTACGSAATPTVAIDTQVATIEPTLEPTEAPATEAPATESPAATDTSGTAGVPVT